WISLAALVATLLVSCTSSINPGLLAIVFAWVIGVYVAPAFGQSIGAKQVMAGFPTELFLTLVGVTFLFSQAKVNGTLEQISTRAVRACKGNAGLVPLAFFLLALAIASIGAGNIAAAALVAPMAMATAGRSGIPAFLMTIMVAHGAIAGALSPFAPTGVIATNLLNQMGLSGHEWHAYVNNLIANAGVALAGYLAFGAWRLFRKRAVEDTAAETSGPAPPLSFERSQSITLALIALVIVSVVGFKVHVGLSATTAGLVLTLLRLADEKEAIRAMPWNVILMVCGVTVLTSLLERTGGTALFTSLLARWSTPRSVIPVVAFVTGLISVYSSTSGVVLPTFLPIVPGLVKQLGAVSPMAVASAMLVGGHLVDSSPLSTIGALCVASASPHEDRRVLFNKVLAWGLSMTVVGALVCYLWFG
ncbi:MAG TPA: SLC13 family permease, partial [Isosphaeraceae bacterium]|nr:SLC13 family permease [Isosphaeraceae bacterium]